MSHLRPPRYSDEVKISFPVEHVLLLTLNRPKSLNAITPQMTQDLKNVLDWFEEEAELWVAIVTGEGRLFCAGGDLIAWNTERKSGFNKEREDIVANAHGSGSLSRRRSNKPIIAAVRGGAYGGGMEILLNCDLVVAAEDARFALLEVGRGTVAIVGGIPRLARIAGHQLASEMLLLGKTIDCADARNRFGFVNFIVPSLQVISTAVSTAQQIIANSPDAVQSTKYGLLLAQQHNVSEAMLTHVWSAHSKKLYKGANIKEGLKAFAEKRAPIWNNPKL